MPYFRFSNTMCLDCIQINSRFLPWHRSSSSLSAFVGSRVRWSARGRFGGRGRRRDGRGGASGRRNVETEGGSRKVERFSRLAEKLRSDRDDLGPRGKLYLGSPFNAINARLIFSHDSRPFTVSEDLKFFSLHLLFYIVEVLPSNKVETKFSYHFCTRFARTNSIFSLSACSRRFSSLIEYLSSFLSSFLDPSSV